MILLSLDPAHSTPLYQQIVDGIRRMVDEGTLAVGARIPPTRVLAARLAVNRSTVLRAYQELWGLGYLDSRQGSYTTVRRRVPTVPAGGARPAPSFSWEAVCTPASRQLYEAHHRIGAAGRAGSGVDFVSLSADRRLAPIDELRRAAAAALREEGAALLDYGSPAGYRPLREMLARRMQTHGISVTADEVMITNGAQHGLDLVLRLLVARGSRVVLESPTYAVALPLLRAHEAELVPIPMRGDGMDLDALERSLEHRRPALVYTMPSFQNPTGVSTSQAHRECLLALCEAHRVPLVEDGFEEELKYFGRATLPIKSMDARGVVIYLGTFSKVVFPGLRVGWIAASREAIDHLVAINRFVALSTTTLAQASLERFCRSGGFEAHLRRVHTAYRRRMQTLLRCLSEHMPGGVTWTQPAGGYTLMVTLRRPGFREEEVLEALQRAGVAVSPGSSFHVDPPAEPSFRLSITNLDEAAIEDGVRRLGIALAEIVGER